MAPELHEEVILARDSDVEEAEASFGTLRGRRLGDRVAFVDPGYEFALGPPDWWGLDPPN